MASINMSCVLLATLLCSALFVTYVASDEEGKHEHHAMMEECMKELGIEGKSPKDSGVSHEKVMGCMMQKSGEITPEGKFSLEKKVEKMSSCMKDEAVRTKAVEAITKCADDINSGEKTPEEIATAVKKCLDDAGVPHPEHHHHHDHDHDLEHDHDHHHEHHHEKSEDDE